MATLDIITYGHPALSQRAGEITDLNDEIVQLASNMVETMHRAPGIGLAAPQVDQEKRLIVVDLSVGENQDDLIIMINPELKEIDGKAVLEEGCLSVPDIREKVVRPKNIVVKGYDLNGREIVMEANDLLARVFCHEIDHLDGLLFIDRISPLKRKLAVKKLKKLAV